MRIAVVVGTRPEFIKTWSVLKELDTRDDVDSLLIHTGQHYDYEMSQAFFEDLSIKEPDYYLDVGSTTTVQQTTKIMQGVSDVLQKEEIDILLVQGDTNSCAGAALATSQMNVPLGHIEAGCRSFDRTMPEELNRIIIDSIANLLFAPSRTAFHNLMMEGSDPNRTFNAGNTALDALEEGVKHTEKYPSKYDQPYAIATIHRVGNVDKKDRLYEILIGLSKLGVKCIFPVHPRTEKMIAQFGLEHLVDSQQLELIKPVGYISFINLLKHSSMVITDSGGVQEEAVLLGKPTITIRGNTEWPETVWVGGNILVEAKSAKIQDMAKRMLSKKYDQKALYLGGAGKRIVDIIVKKHKSDELRFVPSNLKLTGYPEFRLAKVRTEPIIATFDEHGYLSEDEGNRFLVKGFKPLKPE
jgi:UDP-N-acetylglucosamine 2-epimerase (non-hydrolysing)